MAFRGSIGNRSSASESSKDKLQRLVCTFVFWMDFGWLCCTRVRLITLRKLRRSCRDGVPRCQERRRWPVRQTTVRCCFLCVTDFRYSLVSTRSAAKACESIWGVPARAAELNFTDEGHVLALMETGAGFVMQGWHLTRSSRPRASRSPALPLLWTPQIKALWVPIRFLPTTSSPSFNIHRLRLSATSLAVSRFELQVKRIQPLPPTEGKAVNSSEHLPLGFAVSADGLRIEIAEADGLL